MKHNMGQKSHIVATTTKSSTSGPEECINRSAGCQTEEIILLNIGKGLGWNSVQFWEELEGVQGRGVRMSRGVGKT